MKPCRSEVTSWT